MNWKTSQRIVVSPPGERRRARACCAFRFVPRALAATLLLFCIIATAQTSPIIARAVSVNGPVALSSAGGPAFALTGGYPLNPGDLVDTRGGGRVVIDLSDGSMVIVQPGSVVLIKDYRAAATLRELFDITVGQVRVKINHFGGLSQSLSNEQPNCIHCGARDRVHHSGGQQRRHAGRGV